MKNLILVFLVFITTFLKGQSVDPETFPTVVGAISNKNVYTNTGGEGKISVQSIIDSAKLISGDFIPLAGTTVGKPVTGDIEIDAVNTGFLNIKNTTDGNGKFSSIQYADDYGVSLYSVNTDNTENFFSTYQNNPYFSVSSSNSSFRGITGFQDYTANITDLDYTQKIYVDTKASKVGADDIEITDFNKGVILTSPNSSRYRITVDNSGTLITTLIP